jgi:hypothetical protein
MRLSKGAQSIALSVALSAAVLHPAESAGRTDFVPIVALDQGYTDNVGFVGEADEVSGDYTARLGASFQVDHQIRHGYLLASYATGYTTFRDNSALNHDGHRLRFVAYNNPRLNEFRFEALYRQSQDQGRAEELDDADLFITQRTNRQAYGASVSYYHRFREAKWKLGGYLSADRLEFEVIEGFDTGTLLPPEDRWSYVGALDFSRALSRRTLLGLIYVHQFFDLDLSGDESVNNVGMTLDYVTSKKSRLYFQIGAYRRDRDRLVEESLDRDEGVQGRLQFSRSFKRSELSFIGGRAASSGGSLRGTAVNTFVGVSLGTLSGTKWQYGGALRFARREPSNPLNSDVSSASASLYMEVLFRETLNNSVGIRINGSYVDQLEDELQDGRNTGSFYTLWLGLRWYPLGPTRVGRGS